MVRDRLMSQFAVGGVELLMSGHSVVLGVSSLRGAGLLRCASSRRGTGVSPLTGCHPSRDTVRPAVPAETRGGPFPCPGIAGHYSFTLRVNEARLAN